MNSEARASFTARRDLLEKSAGFLLGAAVWSLSEALAASEQPARKRK